MRLLTFVGIGDYDETVYCWNYRRHTTRFVAEALAEMLPADRVLVGLTEGAKAHPNWAGLRAVLGARAVPVAIPDGRTEAEQWAIFSSLAERVERGSTLVIDITHAFRSVPVLAVALASYLREACGVNIADIVYGAYEKGTPEAPIISLAPFLEVIEWAEAAKFLSVSGDSRMLADLLQRKTPDGRARKHGRKLSLLGHSLRKTSEALAMNRANAVAAAAGEALRALDALPKALEPASAPFPVIRESIRQSYEPVRQGGLEGALRLVEWYVEHGRYLQAVTLAGEWLISCAGAITGNPAEIRKDRERISGSLSAEARRRRDEPDAAGVRERIDFTSPDYDALICAWNWVGELRNDLAHCGYRTDPMSAETTIAKAREVPQRLRGLFGDSEKEEAP